jgi:hypothetical protein
LYPDLTVGARLCRAFGALADLVGNVPSGSWVFRPQFGVQHLHVLTLNPIFVVLAFHENEKIRSENSKSCRYIDFIGTIVPVDRLPVFRLKLLKFARGRLQVRLNLLFKLN